MKKEILSLKNISVITTNTQGKKKILLDNISLTIQTNSTVACIGQNGAGKTTTILAMLGLIPLTHGKRIIYDQETSHEINPSIIGYAPDDAQYYPFLTGYEHLVQLGTIGGLNQKEAEKKAYTLLKDVGLSYARDMRVQQYSKGMKQRLGLAISLIHDPKLIIRDEPMNGLDPLGRNIIKQLMQSLHAQGKTFFFSTHILSDVNELADTVVCIHQGKILHTSPMKAISKPLESFFLETINTHTKQIHIA